MTRAGRGKSTTQKLFLVAFIAVLVCTLCSKAHSLPFTFSGSDAGGTGSAIMDISVSDMTLTAVVDNTSPVVLDNASGDNAPGITAFGFDLDPATLTLLSWDLTAYDGSANVVTIGGSGTSAGDWILTINANTNGIKLDYVPNTDNGVKGALYNPAATSGLAALPNYYTQAVLTMVFDDVAVLNLTDPYSPIVRMQNVGLNGGGSLKLPGTPAVPEPTTMLLFGSGLVGLAALGRKRLHRKA